VASARSTGARAIYRVRPSDTLGGIGMRFYGDSTRWREIYEANRQVLPDPNRLTPGVTLVIP
jgi:nucleoid-associated protein YgaU